MALQGKSSRVSVNHAPPVSLRHKMDRRSTGRHRFVNFVPLTDSDVRLGQVVISAEFHSAVKILIGAAVGLAIGFLFSRKR